MTKSTGKLPPRKFWTDAELDQLRTLYPNMRTSELARLMGVKINRIYSKADQLGLKKSEQFFASKVSGRLKGITATRFQKGMVPWNKGTKGLMKGGEATRFKPGHRGGRALEVYHPIGYERVTEDGYIQRKVNDDIPFHKRWRGVHILNWEAVNGPLPPGHAIALRDGNKQNAAIENLELVTRKELMSRNTLHNYPKEIAQAIQLRGAINRKINRRMKSNDHTDHSQHD